jgi:hypothetical protein
MIVIDRALWQGLRFVLENVRRALENEMDDPRRLHEQLLDAQLRFEAGELSREQLTEIEARALARLNPARATAPREPIGVASVSIDTSELPAPAPVRRRQTRQRLGARRA